MRNTRVAILATATVLLLQGPSHAEGKKPPPEKKKSESHATLHDAKEGANNALNSVDQGVHEAAHEVKSGANKALQAVDDTVHGRN